MSTNQGPQPLKPEDDWVRGNALALGRTLADADTSDATLWQRLYLGDAAVRVMRGIAETPDVAKVVGYLVACCEIEVQRGSRALLEMSDISTPKARDLHFDIRVAAEIVSRLNQMVRDGMAAAAEIETHEGDQS